MHFYLVIYSRIYHCIINYECLFNINIVIIIGVDAIKPWGYVQKNLFKKETHEKLKEVKYLFSDTDSNDLKKFIKNYVVDVKWLSK